MWEQDIINVFEISLRRFKVDRSPSEYLRLESITFRVNQLVEHRFILNLSVVTFKKICGGF